MENDNQLKKLRNTTCYEHFQGYLMICTLMMGALESIASCGRHLVKEV